MLLEQCRALNGGRVRAGGFRSSRRKTGPWAVRRFPARWNHGSGGRSRTGPAFCDPGRRSLLRLSSSIDEIGLCVCL